MAKVCPICGNTRVEIAHKNVDPQGCPYTIYWCPRCAYRWMVKGEPEWLKKLREAYRTKKKRGKSSSKHKLK